MPEPEELLERCEECGQPWPGPALQEFQCEGCGSRHLVCGACAKRRRGGA